MEYNFIDDAIPDEPPKCHETKLMVTSRQVIYLWVACQTKARRALFSYAGIVILCISDVII